MFMNFFQLLQTKYLLQISQKVKFPICENIFKPCLTIDFKGFP